MKKLFEFKIKDPIIVSENKYRVQHWATRNKTRESQMFQVYAGIGNYNIKPIENYPVKIQFELIKPRPIDCDNLVTKYLIDALVKYKIIKGDSPKYVNSVEIISKSGKPPLLIITIYSSY